MIFFANDIIICYFKLSESNDDWIADSFVMFWEVAVYLIAGCGGPVKAGCGSGASTVSTPSLDKLERISSGFTPVGSKNSRLYSR